MKQGKTEKTEANNKESRKPGRLKHWAREAIFMAVIFTAVSVAVDLWRGQEIPDGEMPEMVVSTDLRRGWQVTTIPTVTVSTLQGERLDVKAMSYEKPVLIYFWATWCSICWFVSPTINWMSNEYPVVSVALSSGENARLAGYLEHHEYDFPTINDSKGVIARQWGISATPTVVIVRNGRVVSSTTGIITPPGIWLRMQLAR